MLFTTNKMSKLGEQFNRFYRVDNYPSTLVPPSVKTVKYSWRLENKIKLISMFPLI